MKISIHPQIPPTARRIGGGDHSAIMGVVVKRKFQTLYCSLWRIMYNRNFPVKAAGYIGV
jgi:hypothetical protein